MSSLSKEDVFKLAHLCRIAISEEEAEAFQRELSEILGYVEQLQSVDTEGFETTNQVTGLSNVTRVDEEIDYGYEPTDLLKNVPATKDNQIKVKRMIG